MDSITKLFSKLVGDKVSFAKRVFDTLAGPLDSLRPGMYEITIRKAREPKTAQQTKTIFGLLIEKIIVKANDEGIDTSAFLKMMVESDVPNGVPLTKDFLYQFFLICCPVCDEEGRRLTLSKFSKEQAAGFLDRCVDLMCSHGIYIPPPDPNWKDKL